MRSSTSGRPKTSGHGSAPTSNGDDRRKIDNLLAETASVEALPCDTEVEALVLEARLIHRHGPRYNRRGKAWRRYAYVKLDLAEAWPRLKVVRKAQGEGVFLGPFGSSARARQAKEALEDVFPIRRCTARMAKPTRFSPCALADLGRCVAPCDGRVTPERYEELVRSIQLALSFPGGLLEALEARMSRLADAERFEEAALARDRLGVLVEALIRARTERWLVESGRLVVEEDGRRLVFRRGALVRRGDERGYALPIPLEAADEVRTASRWIEGNSVRFVEAEGTMCERIEGGAMLARIRRRIASAMSRPG